MDGWLGVKQQMHMSLRELESSIYGYSYADMAKALSTDQKICAFLVEQFRTAKKKLFNIINTLYEMQLESKIDKDAARLKDDIDIFSDEIKVRHCKLKEMPSDDLLKKIIQLDYRLVKGVQKFNSDLDVLYDRLMAGLRKDHGIKTHPELYSTFWVELKGYIGQFDEQMEQLIIAFREREAICNLKPLSLQRTLQRIQRDIRESV